MTGKQEGPYKGEETKAEEDKVWQSENQHIKVISERSCDTEDWSN